MPILQVTASQRDDGPLIEQEGWFEATVKSVDPKTQKALDDTGNPRVRMNFRFQITEPGPFKDKSVWGSTPMTFTEHPDCKLRGWASEILNTELGLGDSMNTDLLVNQPCRVFVSVNEWIPDNAEKDPETGEFIPRRSNTVTDVARVLEGHSTTSAAVPLADQPW